jgi:hypothetical protein
LADAQAVGSGQASEQGAGGDSQRWMVPVRSDLEQRHEHECAQMHLGMRQHEMPLPTLARA